MSKLNKFLILIIIINLFASIFIIFSTGKTTVNNEETFEIDNYSEFVSTYMAGPSPERYKSFIQGLVENKFDKLYEDTKNLTDTQLKSYYEKNNTTNDISVVSYMQSEYGISDYETLQKISDKIRSIKDNDAKYKKCTVVKKSCKMNYDYTTSDVVFTYSKSLKFTLTIEMSNIIQYDVQTFRISVKEDE